MWWVDVVSRIVHIAMAITLVGGSVFTLFALLPATSSLSDDSRAALADAIRRRWERFVHVGVTLFLLSGFYNYLRAIPDHKGDGLYHALIGTKMLLAFAVFFMAAALVGRSSSLESFRNQQAKWVRVLVLFAALIVCISGFVKVRGIPAGIEATTTSAASK